MVKPDQCARYRIVRMTEARVDAYHSAFDRVARERTFFPQLKAPPVEEMRTFVRNILRARDFQYVAVVGDEIVGWCDIVRGPRDARRHTGLLAIGVVPDYRRRGIGTELMTRAITAAWKRGLTRIGLTVRADNRAAIALYRGLGFKTEGRQRKAIRMRGKYFDQLSMALIKGDQATE
jgi:ribosomal protein S18 acetylase RimI-like enzyme